MTEYWEKQMVCPVCQGGGTPQTTKAEHCNNCCGRGYNRVLLGGWLTEEVYIPLKIKQRRQHEKHQSSRENLFDNRV